MIKAQKTKKILLLAGIVLTMSAKIFSAETILLGYVRNAGSGEVIENASVYFKGTKIGTSTDHEGFFYLRVDVREKVRLVVSAVGYKKQTFEVEPGGSSGMEVLLEERTDMLQEVIAISSDDPATQLMARLRDSKRKIRHNTSPRPTNGETKTRYFISDIRPRQLRHRMWRSLQSGMIQQADSTYMIPLPEDSWSGLIVPLPEEFDFYRSNIPFHTVSFISPLAFGSGTYYRFYLLDSVTVSYDGLREKHYRLHFVPRNNFDPVLEGVLEVDSASATLRRVSAHAPREANINYLNALQYEALYQPDATLSQETLCALLETETKLDTTKIFPSLYGIRTTYFDSPIVTSGKPLQADTLQATDSAVSVFLEQKRPAPLPAAPSDSAINIAEDSLANTPLYRFARWAAELIYTGYIPTGTAVDIGQIPHIIGYTPHEHLYLGLPFRTNERMSRHISLNGCVNYGFRDRGVKYHAAMEVLLPTERRHLLSLSVCDRYSAVDVHETEALQRENSWLAQNLNFTSYAFRNLIYNKASYRSTAVRKREVRIASENDWCASNGNKPSVESTISIQLGRQGYGDAMQYHYYDMPSFRYASVRGIVRLGWHEGTADFFTIRKHIHSDYPTLFVGTELGSYRLDDASSYAIYGRLNIMLRQDVPLGIAGRLSYIFDAGIVLGRVPYPFLSLMNGNQGYTYQPERFTLMNNLQYAADRYIMLHLDWNGRGVLFSRIPGVRYARLHELAEIKFAYGGLSSKHHFFGNNFSSLAVPYVETGVGIGNILRVGEVWSVWRLTHRDDPSSALWAIRFRLHFGL